MLRKHYSETVPFCRVTFALPLEAVRGGREVRLLGDFNAWRWEDGFRLQPRGTQFEADVELPAGQHYEFRYLIDNAIWENDWDADAYVPTPFGVDNSVVSLSEVVAPQARLVQEHPDLVAQGNPPIAPENGAGGGTRAAVDAADSADDLTMIEGIGPKLAELLNAAGIGTFAGLAATKPDMVSRILEAAGRRYVRHDPSTWPEQAKLAAEGDWKKLARLQERLSAGKRA